MRLIEKEKRFAECFGNSLLDLSKGDLAKARQRSAALKTNFGFSNKKMNVLLRRLKLK